MSKERVRTNLEGFAGPFFDLRYMDKIVHDLFGGNGYATYGCPYENQKMANYLSNYTSIFVAFR